MEYVVMSSGEKDSRKKQAGGDDIRNKEKWRAQPQMHRRFLSDPVRS
jgi:hypothetical protein